MEAIEISREEWPGFFRLLTRLASHRPVQVEEDGLQIGAQQLGERLTFDELSYDLHHSELRLMASTPAGESIGHRIGKPRSVFATHDASGWLEVISIESDDHRTLISFERPPMIAEQTAHA